MAFAFNQAEFEEVEFQTLDQLTLKARLYPASERGPAIIMNPGYNCTKEISVPSAATYFQRHGITTMIYDPRNCGQSEGTPRREIDPHRHVDDYLDALTFMAGLEIVDPEQIGLWGVSFSATIALAAACYDPRAQCVMAVSPWTFEFGISPEQAKENFARLVSERESQALGNEPFYTAMVDQEGNNPIHLGVDWGDEVRAAITEFASLSADGFVPTVTFQSYYKIFTFSPYVALPYLGDTPAMMVVPEHDTICPVEQQVRLYEAIKGPKEIYHAARKRHLTMLQEDAEFEPMMQAQVDFFKKAVRKEQSF
ncbi:alpha/beta-hydrolase [Aspergillus cavernicola]|uniref:Alpha/beta-hydrolase n=1 Tax=Aspergillus cavernicola TaxID=176166 RepID=A0ABR4HXF1_9EURO